MTDNRPRGITVASARHVNPTVPAAPGRRLRRPCLRYAAFPLAAGLLAAGCGGAPAPPAATPPSAGMPRDASLVTLTTDQLSESGITTATVTPSVPTRQLSLTGAVGYDETVTARVAPRIPGRVVQIVSDFGAEVRAGDVLAVLDSPELGESQAAYLARLAEYRVAQRALDRAETLWRRKAISEGEYLERQGALRRAEAELGLAENRLHLYDMDDTEIAALGVRAPDGSGDLHGAVSPQLTLRSPIVGTVTRREVSAGQVVDRLETLYVVSDLTRLWAWLDVYERDLGAIREGQEVAILSESLPDARFAGRLDFIGEVEPETRAARVRVRIANPGRRLRPGMFVRARLTAPAGTGEVLAVPREAVQEMDGRQVVFRALGDGRFRPVPVTLGEAFDGTVEIADGLAAGDEIVTAGAFTLKGQALRGELVEEE